MSVFAALLYLATTTVISLGAESLPGGNAQSPSAAMRRVFQIDQIMRVNVVEPYAIVKARGQGGLFDGRPAEFLLEHFDFGWQVLEFAGALCAPDRGLSPQAVRRLLTGMSTRSRNDSRGCDRFLDHGPSRSVEQIRSLMYGPMVPSVRVVDNYAYSEDYGDGGSCGLFHYEAAANRWKLLGVCKGALGLSPAQQHAIPQKTLCALRVALDLKCPRKI